jgi:hypothetical protein
LLSFACEPTLHYTYSTCKSILGLHHSVLVNDLIINIVYVTMRIADVIE